MFDIDAILAKSDLVEYVRRAGGELTGGGGRYACACPLHGGDNNTAFSIYHKDGRWLWNCFTGGDCGGGDAITFVQKWLNKSFREACEWINGGQIDDAEGMKVSAEDRLRKAEIEAQAAAEREQARRRELQVAELHLRYHKNMPEWIRGEWVKAGIDEGMQDFWTLGGSEDFTYKIGDDLYHTPTMTIPIFDTSKELLTIQHRLLNPHNPKDKYRPERTGLHAHPFLAVPEMGYDGDIIFVVEGAKKAMVTWTRSGSWSQCIGVASQEMYKPLIEILKPVGERVIVVPDPNTASNPNAVKKAYALAKGVGGKILPMAYKIDDLIIATDMQENDLFAMAKQARKA